MAVEDYPGRFYSSSFDILAPERLRGYLNGEEAYYLQVVSIPSVNIDEIEAMEEYPPSIEGLQNAIRQLLYEAENRVAHNPDVTRLLPVSLSVASKAIHDLMHEPVILLEGSPATGTSPAELLGKLADGAPDFLGGATLAMTLIGNSPWLVLAIPAGVILFKVSREVGAALGEVAGDWIRQLKPSRRDPG